MTETTITNVTTGGRSGIGAAPLTVSVLNFDLLVELPEKLERDVRYFELADDVPCDKRVKDLFCDVERRKVLHLGLES